MPSSAVDRADSRSGPEPLLKLLQPGIAAWNSGDLDTAIALIDPEIEWHSAQVFPDIEPVYHGHDGVRRFWATFIEPWEEIELDVVEVLDAIGTPDDGALAIRARFNARGRDGIEVDLDVFQVFKVRARKLVEFRVYLDADEARAAAALG